ncbi:MAG: hypothetical protein P8173_16595, partial [Gammaproteobacteria bacterium]
SVVGTLRNDGGLYVYDVTNVTNSLSPSLLKLDQDNACSGVPAGYYGVALSETSTSQLYKAYIADSQQKMWVFTADLRDLTNPTIEPYVSSTTCPPSVTESYVIPGSPASPVTSIVQPATDPSKVFVGTSGYNVKVIDVTDPALPTFTYSDPSINPSNLKGLDLQAWGLTVSPDDSQLIAYTGMQPIVDEINLASSQFNSSAQIVTGVLPTGVMAAAYYGNKQILAVGASGTALYFATADLTDPAAPTKRGEGVAAIPAYDGTGIGVSYSQDTNMAYVAVFALHIGP